MLLLKAGASWNKYFINRRQIFLSGLFGGLFVSFSFSFFLWFVDYDKITLFISCLLIENTIYNKKKKKRKKFIIVQNSRKCCNQSLQNGPTCFVMCHTFVLLAQMYLIFIFMLSLKIYIRN